MLKKKYATLLLGCLASALTASVRPNETAESPIRIPLIISHELNRDDHVGDSVGFNGIMVLQALSNDDALLLINRGLLAATLERVQSFLLRAKLENSPEHLLLAALEGFRQHSKQWYEQLEAEDLTDHERFSIAINQARAEVAESLDPLSDQIHESEFTYAQLSLELLMAPVDFETKRLFSLGEHYILVAPKKFVDHDSSEQLFDFNGLTTIELDSLSSCLFRTHEAQHMHGVLSQQLAQLFPLLSNDDIWWDIILHSHGQRWALPEFEEQFALVAELNMNDAKRVLKLCNDHLQPNIFIISTCFSGGQTAHELHEFAQQAKISFPILTSTSFDTVSSVWRHLQSELITQEGVMDWETFFDACLQHTSFCYTPGEDICYEIKQTLFKDIPFPVNEQSLLQLEQAHRDYAFPDSANNATVLLPGKAPVVLNARKITCLDVALAKTHEHTLLHGSKLNESNVILDTPYIDCTLGLEGTPLLLSSMPGEQSHYFESIELLDATVQDLFAIFQPLEMNAFQKHFAIKALNAQAGEKLEQLLKAVLPDQDITDKWNDILVWQPGRERTQSLFIPIGSNVVRIDKIRSLDEEALNPYGIVLYETSQEAYQATFDEIEQQTREYSLSSPRFAHMRAIVEAHQQSNANQEQLNTSSAST